MANNKMAMISDFYCTYCGKKGIPILRKRGQEREPGHLKKMFCLYCNTERNMVEIKSKGKYTLEHFRIEYEGGNFQEGKRIKPYKQFISEYIKERGGGYIGNVYE